MNLFKIVAYVLALACCFSGIAFSKEIKDLSIPKVDIITKGVGEHGAKFPGELSLLWEPITISSKETPLLINIKCADFPQRKLIDYKLPEPEVESDKSFFDKFRLQTDKSKYLQKVRKIKSSLLDSNYNISSQCNIPESEPTQEQDDWLSIEVDLLKKGKTPSSIIYWNASGESNSEKLIFTNEKEIRDYIAKNYSEILTKENGESALSYLIIYHFDLFQSQTKPLTPSNTNNGRETSKKKTLVQCNQEILVQGIQFLSLAEGSKNNGVRQSNLNNAFQLFNRAVEESQAAGGCCGKALMNRGIARDYLQEPKLALEDLKAAADGQCSPPDKDILFNLACHYSKHSSKDSSRPDFTLDLALQTLEKSVAAGFKDCDVLMTDKDLANLRDHPSYKDRFRRMLNQHGLYCH